MNQAFKACRWCGQPATTSIEIAPVQLDAKKFVKHAAIEVDLCAQHASSLAHAKRRDQLEVSIRKLNDRLKAGPKTAIRQKIVKELGEARLALAELNSPPTVSVLLRPSPAEASTERPAI
jgi:hypothetical protein